MSDQATQATLATAAKEVPQMLDQHLPKEVIDKATAHLDAAAAASTGRYSANGNIVSLILWTKCQCYITNGKTFNGSIWGVSTPGGGALMGDVYTDDVNRLYAETTGFVLIATPVYTTFIFHDTAGNTLGSFQAGAVSTVVSPPLSASGSWK